MLPAHHEGDSLMASEKTPIPIVLVGCGAVSQSFYQPTLRLLAAAGEIVVHSLVDPQSSARASLARTFPSAREAGQISAVDAPAGSLAIIATPARFHAVQSCEAFASGWHVLCEKPMATSISDCMQMIDAADAAQRLLAIGLYKRFFPSSRYLKDIIANRKFGALKSFSIAEGGPFKWPAATPSFFDKTQTSGGVLLDIGVHVLDLLSWWLGDPEAFSYADDAMGGLETNARLTLHYPGQTMGAVHLSRDWATSNEYRFIFEEGMVCWQVNEANRLTVQLNDTPLALHADLVWPRSESFPLSSRPTESNPQSFIAQMQNVLGAIRETEKLLVPGEAGICSLRLIEQCYQSRTLIKQPWLTPAEALRAEQLSHFV